jgi:cbb3-type cytochrome oxidase maturation protein
MQQRLGLREFCAKLYSYMSVIFLLVFFSIAIAGCFLGAFIWCVKNNQYEDQKGASMRILLEDEISRQ